MDAECSLRLFTQANGMFRTRGNIQSSLLLKPNFFSFCWNVDYFGSRKLFIGWICLFFVLFLLIPVVWITRRRRTDAPSLFAEELSLPPKVRLVRRHSARGWLPFRKRPSTRLACLGTNLQTRDVHYKSIPSSIQVITYQCQGWVEFLQETLWWPTGHDSKCLILGHVLSVPDEWYRRK